MNKPTLSIALIANNVEGQLTETVHRIIESDLGVDFELLLIDSDSQDDTFSAATELARRFPNVSVAHGGKDAMRIAMRSTKGDFVLVAGATISLKEIRDLLRVRSTPGFVLASVFANQIIVRTGEGDQVVTLDHVSKSNARLISRRQVATSFRVDTAHQPHENKESAAVRLKPLSHHGAHS